jgi:hypothetical protein
MSQLRIFANSISYFLKNANGCEIKTRKLTLVMKYKKKKFGFLLLKNQFWKIYLHGSVHHGNEEVHEDDDV